MSAVYNSTVQGFYLSYYGRPADPAGLTFWTGQLAAAGGNLSAILNAFGTSAEATRRYGTGTTESKIQAVYQQTFGRAADATGLAFYNTEITAGRITLIDMSKRIIDGATGDDVLIRNNRLSAAQSFTDKLDTDAEKAGYSGSGAEDAARSWVATVTKDVATVTAAVATADATITALLPQTFALTVNQDKWTGSAGNDAVSGGVTTLSTTNTLGATDQIDGGAGTDTADISFTTDFAGFTVGTGFMKNVETVNINVGVTNASPDFTARGVTGVTTYNVKGPADLLGLSSLTPVINYSGVSGTAGITGLTVGFDQEVVVGTADKFAIGVSSLGTAATGSTTAPSAVSFTTTGVESLTISATGTNFIGLAVGTGTDTPVNLTINGSGNVDMAGSTSAALNYSATADGVSEDLKTIDASALEGTFRVNLANAASMTSVKGSLKGANTFIANFTDTTGDLVGNATVTGGEGADTLVANLVTGARTLGLAMSAVETLRLQQVDQDLTFSASATTGLTTVVASNAAGDGTARNNGAADQSGLKKTTVSGLGSANIAIQLNPDSSTSTDKTNIVVDTTGKVTGTVPIASTVTAKATTTVSTDDITATKAGTVEISIPQYADWQGSLIAAAATSITISGAGDWNGDITNTYTVDTTDGILSADAVTDLKIDQTSKSESWAMLLTTSGSSVASTLRNLDLNLLGESAGSTLGTVRDLTKLETLKVNTSHAFGATTANTLGANANLTKLTSITLSGATASSAVTLGNVGASTLAYGTTVNASGLVGGLTIGTMDVGSTQALTLNISGVKGNATFSNLAANTGGSVTVNAKGFGDGTTAGNLSLGTVTATSGTVTLDLANAKGTLTVGAVSGNTVSVLADGAASTLNGGSSNTLAVTAKDSATVTLPQLAAHTVNVTAGSGSTALVVDVKGGILGDTLNVTSTQTGQTSVTVKGNLGDGTDSVTVTATGYTGTATQTITIADVTGYESSTIRGSAVKDSITGGAGKDTIIGGAGADTLRGGAGADTFTLNQAADTGAITSASVTKGNGTAATTFTNTYTVTGGDSVSAVSFDKIMDFVIGDQLVTNANATRSNLALDSATNGIGQTGDKDLLITGTYNATADSFTFGSGGGDSLYVFSATGTGTTDLRAIVLVGYATTLSATAGADNTGLIGVAS